MGSYAYGDLPIGRAQMRIVKADNSTTLRAIKKTASLAAWVAGVMFRVVGVTSP